MSNGIVSNKGKYDYIKYDDRYVYCETCLAKIKFNDIYVTTHCLNKTHMFCSRECYGKWVFEK